MKSPYALRHYLSDASFRSKIDADLAMIKKKKKKMQAILNGPLWPATQCRHKVSL